VRHKSPNYRKAYKEITPHDLSPVNYETDGRKSLVSQAPKSCTLDLNLI